MDLTYYLSSLIALFVIIDPIGAAIIFHTLVGPQDFRYRAHMAFKAILIALILLLVFGFYGEILLAKIGISIEALRISGGLLLFYTAFNMVTQDLDTVVTSEKKDISVYPMSIPLLAGPGSLTLIILLFAQSASTEKLYSVIFSIVTILVLTLVLLLMSGYIKKAIGRTGDEILRRFLGVLLAALAIQFIADGIAQFSANF